MRLFTTLVLAFLCLHTFAQEEEKTSAFTFSGSGDVYFRAKGEAPATSFGNLEGFALGMLNLKASYQYKNTGVVADLVLGPRGEDATFMSPLLRAGGSSNVINQLYLFWDVTDKITLTMGNFNTFVGYEVISPVDNFHYTTSYLFSYGPFSHTGLKADFDLGNGFTAMAGVFNATDETEYNWSDHYYGGAQIGYEKDNFSNYANVYFDDKKIQLDLVTAYDFSDQTHVEFNGSWNSDLYWGAALYVEEDLTDDLSLGLRGEHFVDTGLGLYGDKEKVNEVTASLNYSIGNLRIIPEVRIDWAANPHFADQTEKMLGSYLVAAVYAF